MNINIISTFQELRYFKILKLRPFLNQNSWKKTRKQIKVEYFWLFLTFNYINRMIP